MSKITISTTQLQALVNKASQGVGANKLLDISNYIGIKATSDGLSLYTTDGENTLWVSMSVESSDNIDVTVNAETFIKLINKLTSDTVTLEADDKALTISGNGSYKLDLKLDDEGNILSFPTNDFSGEFDGVGTITPSDIQTMQSSLKSALSTNAGSAYSEYYVGEFISATDKAMLGLYEREVFTSEDTKFLWNSRFVDLLMYAGADVSLAYNIDSGTLIANAPNFILITKATTDCSDYNISGLKKMLEIEQDSYCRIRKKEILDLLDRLSLFVKAFDDGAITLEFTLDSVKVSSLSSNGVETIDFMESKNAKEKTIKININRLISQLKSYTSDSVDLYYGSDLCIKLVDGDVTQVIALMR